MTKNLELKSKILKGFADPSRLKILEVLRHKNLTVSEIMKETKLTQSNTSNHLACLKECGLVTSKHVRKNVFYKLSCNHVRNLLEFSDILYGEIGEKVESCTHLNKLKFKN